MRKYTILIPHYKTAKMTAYCLSQVCKHSQGRDIRVVVIDNSPSEKDELVKCTQFENVPEHLKDKVWNYLPYPTDKMQSHGLAFDYAITEGMVKTDYFITLESDSFPTQDNWLDYYDNLIEQGYEMAASKMKLSGGEYLHPAGAMYKLSIWIEAKEFVEDINTEYHYLPNFILKDGFPCHIMLRHGIAAPKDSEFHHSYKHDVDIFKNINNYLPIAQSVFHQGMGSQQESYLTYGQRDIEYGKKDILNITDDLIYRMGYEPGQWFGYWHYSCEKKVKQIPTQIVWMPNRVNEQQEYTLTENGVKHLWGVTAYGTSPDNESLQDIINRKKQLINELYESI